MVNIKKFIDKVSYIEGRQGKDIILPITEARGLRDEIAKLLVDHQQLTDIKKNNDDDVIKVEIIGGKF